MAIYAIFGKNQICVIFWSFLAIFDGQMAIFYLGLYSVFCILYSVFPCSVFCHKYLQKFWFLVVVVFFLFFFKLSRWPSLSLSGLLASKMAEKWKFSKIGNQHRISNPAVYHMTIFGENSNFDHFQPFLAFLNSQKWLKMYPPPRYFPRL